MTNQYEYQFSGTLAEDSLTYVTRPADDDLFEALKAGYFCYVLNSRQMGKSSLRVRTIQRLKKIGFACVDIDTTLLGSEQVTAEQWYTSLADNIVSDLGLSDSFDFYDWWFSQEHFTPVKRLNLLLEKIVFEKCDNPVIIFVDEIDYVLSLPFSTDDLFAFIRACFNKRADNPSYRRLNFALLGVVSPSDLIRDTTRTPFNIGQSIELKGFSSERCQPLEKGFFKISETPKEIVASILEWTGGQPFLTQKICNLVLSDSSFILVGNEDRTVEKVIENQVLSNWEINDNPEHLKTIRTRILNSRLSSRMLSIYKSILEQGFSSIKNTPEEIELRLSGLVFEDRGKLKAYNKIYSSIFDINWVNSELKNLRPYSEALEAWTKSGLQDSSRLLTGQALQDALIWSEGRSLSDEDYQFLAASQKFEQEEVQKALQAEQEANEILSEARQKAEEALEEEKKSVKRLEETRKKTVSTLLMGFGGLVVITFLLFSIVRSFNRQANLARQSEARNTVGAMGRGQQAYYLEFLEFAENIQDLQVGISEETDNYIYEIVSVETYGVGQVARAKTPNLKSYSGGVFITSSSDGRSTSSAYICETIQPSLIAPEPPYIDFQESKLICPNGTHVIDQGKPYLELTDVQAP